MFTNSSFRYDAVAVLQIKVSLFNYNPWPGGLGKHVCTSEAEAQTLNLRFKKVTAGPNFPAAYIRGEALEADDSAAA